MYKENFEKLKSWFSERSIGQEDIALRTGLSQSYISLILNKKREINWNLAKKLEEAYGLSADWLMKNEGEITKSVYKPTKEITKEIKQSSQNNYTDISSQLKEATENLERYKELTKQQSSTIESQQKQIEMLLRQLERYEKLTTGGSGDGN